MFSPLNFHLHIYLGGKVKKNHQLNKIAKLKMNRQFSSLETLEHQYLKNAKVIITQICFL